MWLLPAALIVFTLIVAIPLSKYIAWIMEGKYRPWTLFSWIEKRLDTGPMNWKQYTGALLIFNTVLFIWGFVVLSLQPVIAAKRSTPGDAVPNHHL
jgi:K+-transporting ATPase ATPase A chain